MLTPIIAITKIFETIGSNIYEVLHSTTKANNPNYVEIGINNNQLISKQLLISAAKNGHTEVVTSLLQFDGIDLNFKSWTYAGSNVLEVIQTMVGRAQKPPIKHLTLCYIAILQKKFSMSFISALNSLINNGTAVNQDYILPREMLESAKGILAYTTEVNNSTYISNDCKNIVNEYLDFI